jgi:transposase
MAIDLSDTRSESNDVLEALRLRAVHARELGYSLVDIAAILGLREETVSRWCSKYEQGGAEALPGERTGPSGPVACLQQNRNNNSSN